MFMLKNIIRVINGLDKDSVLDYNGPWVQRVVIPQQEFAPGMWAGMEGAKFKVTEVNLTTREVILEYIGFDKE